MSQPRPRSSRDHHGTGEAHPTLSYRAARLPSGALLPIEVRLGRRVLRVIAPDCSEGRALLRAGKVDIVVASEN